MTRFLLGLAVVLTFSASFASIKVDTKEAPIKISRCNGPNC